MTKPLIITAFITGGTTEWRYPGDTSYRFASDLEAWVEIAKLLEKGKIYALFIADHLTLFDVYKGPNNYRDAVKTGLNVPKADPSHAIITAARETKNISFGVTFSTVSEHPYLFARRLATLDHFTQGRVGWNIVTSYLNSIGTQLLNGEPFPEHDERYNRATEYVDVVSGLLLCWTFYHAAFSPKNPAFDSSRNFKKGQELAAEFAEFVYVLGGTEELAPKINYIRTIAKEKFGRNPKNIKVIYSARVILGRTHDEAIEKEASYKKSEVPDRNAVNFGGVTGIDLNEYDSEEEIETKNVNGVKTTTEVYFKSAKKPTKNALLNKAPGAGPLVGTSEEVADKLEKLVEELDLDGFNFNSAVLPGSVEDLVELLIPELQRRGLFWEDYAVPGGTFRENVYGVKGQTFLPPDHPLYDTRWTPDANKEKFDKIYEQNLERRKQARTSLN
ncbi:hypothetical protein KL933_001646 [Ogataea haglerorum]|uniref:Luciferase-like domain-containing protein n=1 Tax=Ogataea haglerorum TaxID=1937702 RepID=A0AAN6I1L9_9ASCO|nr:hypothetical protein KL933_001646 [Ogataea haglerorum]